MLDRLKTFMNHQILTFRNVVLVLLVVVLLHFDLSTMSLLTYSFGLVAANVLATHVFRKLLFPYLDLSVHLDSALKERNAASAMVFLGMCTLISVLLICSTLLLVQ